MWNTNYTFYHGLKPWYSTQLLFHIFVVDGSNLDNAVICDIMTLGCSNINDNVIHCILANRNNVWIMWSLLKGMLNVPWIKQWCNSMRMKITSGYLIQYELRCGITAYKASMAWGHIMYLSIKTHLVLEHYERISSILWLLMPWLLALTSHQQPWYWICRFSRYLSSIRMDFNYICDFNVKNWKYIYIYVSIIV